MAYHKWNVQGCSDRAGLSETKNSIKRGLELCLRAKTEKSTSELFDEVKTFSTKFNSIDSSIKALNNRIGALESANQKFMSDVNSVKKSLETKIDSIEEKLENLNKMLH